MLRLKVRPAANLRRPNPARMDPSRTSGLRRQWIADLRRRFARIRARLLELVRDEDAFGLATRISPIAANEEACPLCGQAMILHCGGKGGKPGPCPKGDKAEPKQGRLARLGKAIGAKVAATYERFSERYGKKGAVAMIAAMAVTFPIPGNVLAVIGAAEAIKAVGKMVGHEAADVEAMLAEIAAAVGEPLSDAELARLRGALASALRGEQPAVHQRFAFVSDPAKLRAFRDWLSRLLASELIGRSEDELWLKYVQEGFKKGQGRVWDDFKRRSDPEYLGKPEGFFEGTRQEFLRSSFANPVAVEKVKLLAARTFEDVKSVAEEMRTRLGRVLTDGLVQGMHPREVARDMAEQLDLSYSRAERIARTETIRAHAEGQLTALEDLGVTEVGVMVEWTVTNDSVLCPRCEEMEGVVLKTEDARGLLPLHPNCRCAWLPAGVGEGDEGQLRGRAAQRAMRRADASWRGGSRLAVNAKLARLVSALSERDRAFRRLLLNAGRKR